MRRSIRDERNRERKIALQQRWHVGALATIVAGALVFSGMTPAVADEAVTSQTTEEATAAAAAEPDATAEEPAAPAEETPAEEPAAPAEEPAAPAEEEPAAPAEETPAEEPAAPEDEAASPDEGAALGDKPVADKPSAQRNAAPEAVLLAALPCDGWPVAGSPVAGFEIDGNLCLDGDGTIDWATIGGQPRTNDTYDDATQWTQGAKESNWPWSGGQASGNGVAPAKTDVGNVYAYTQTVAGHVYAYLGFERAVNNGSVSYHVELNKLANSSPAVPNRSIGDLRLTIEQTGSNIISLVGADRWNGTAWVSLGNLSGFVGQVNQDEIENLSGEVLEAGTFAEAAIDLTVLFGNAGCSGTFGVMNVRSSSSPEETSSLADWINPIALSVPSTCSTLTILKTGPTGAPLAGAQFTISPNPATGTGSTTGTTDANGTIVFSGNVQPGTYTVTETVAPPGYLLDSTPQQVTFGDTAQSKTLTFVDPLGGVSWLKHDRAGMLLGGATFQITATAGAAAAAPWDLDSAPITVVDNTGQPGYSGRDTDATAGEFTVAGLPTGTYSVNETAAPAGYVLDPSSKSFTVSQQTPNPTISTAFVNTPYATVTLTKVWVNSFAGDTAQLTIGGDASAQGTSTAPTNGPAVQVSVAPGSELTLAEALGGSNKGSYTSVLTCTGATVTGNTGVAGGIVVPSWPASANGVQCTFTNTAVTKTITLQKKWVDAIIGDEAELHAGADTDTSVATQPDLLDTTNTATVTARVGDTVSLSEELTGAGSYASTYSCTSGTTSGNGTGTAFTVKVPATDATCTFTNTAARATVTLQKEWIDAFAGDEADLEITGAAQDSATSIATEGDSVDDENVASVTVRIGEKVSLSESIDDAGNTGSYTATWECDNGTDGSGETIGELTVTGNVNCTITNTAKTVDVVVEKTWVNAFEGDTADLSINGESGTSTASGAAEETDAEVVTLTVRVGDEVDVMETLDDETNTGRYSSVYDCSVADGDGPGRQTSFIAPDEDVVCTFTNTAIVVGVLLQKRWIGGVAGDRALLSAALTSGAVLKTATSIRDGLEATFLDEVRTVLVQVRIGERLRLAETFEGSGVYASAFGCTSGTTSAAAPDGRSFELTVSGASVCIFANRAVAHSLTVVKTWINGQDGDTADLTIAGGATGTGVSTANGQVGTFTDLPNAVVATATVGQDVTVSEVVEVLAGSPSDYASSLTCIGADQTVVFEGDIRTGTFPMPDQPVECEFVNEAELPTIALEKVVVVEGADVPDTNWQLFATPEEGDAVTNAAGGDVEPTEVSTGIGFGLSEELIVDFTGSDEFTAGEWSCMSDVGGEIDLSDSVAGSASLRALNKGENVVCMIVNSHQDQGYTFDKSFVSSVQDEETGEWTVVYSITVHNNSVLVPIVYDLSDTIDEPEGVTILDASWTGPTAGDYDPDASLTAKLADDQVLAAYDSEAENDDVYTVTVLVDVTSLPEDPETCVEEGGIGVVNTATLTVGDEEPVTDDACGTVHYDDVMIEKTATNIPEEGSVEPGDVFSYELTVTNNGTQPAKVVRVYDDSLSFDPYFDRLTINSVVVTPDTLVIDDFSDLEANIVDLDIAELAPGEVATVTVTVEFFAPADNDAVELGDLPDPLESIVNTACVSTDLDPIDGATGDNNCDDETVETRDMTASIYTTCISDAPLLGVIVKTSGALAGAGGTMTWVPEGATAETDPAQVVVPFEIGEDGYEQVFEWPGSAYTPSGVAIDYPGWRAIQASDYTDDGRYIDPEDGLPMTAEEQQIKVFNGLILDASELDFAWRGLTTITIEVNPTQVFQAEYPPASPECFQARHTELEIDKTASVERTQPGGTHTYDLAVQNVSTDSAAENVVVTDEIPADLKVTGISWPGEGDDSVFPNWESCEVSGQDSAGFGGTLECVLFGPLQPQGSDNGGATSAPTITLSATVHSATTSTAITNVAFVDYHTFGDPDDPGRDSDDATVTLSQLPATGGGDSWPLALFGLFALLAGVTTLLVVRRRRGEVKPML